MIILLKIGSTLNATTGKSFLYRVREKLNIFKIFGKAKIKFSKKKSNHVPERVRQFSSFVPTRFCNWTDSVSKKLHDGTWAFIIKFQYFFKIFYSLPFRKIGFNFILFLRQKTKNNDHFTCP